MCTRVRDDRVTGPKPIADKNRAKQRKGNTENWRVLHL